MAENIKQERMRWVEPIAEGRTAITEVMKVFPYGKRTLERWLGAYRRGGELALEPRSTRPKTSPKETPQNGTVERSHGSDQRTLYDSAVFSSPKDLRKKVALWNIEYNDLEHCGLNGKTPNEALAEFKN